MKGRSAARITAPVGDGFTAVHQRLGSQLDVLRTALADHGPDASNESARRGYSDLDRCLRSAMTNALGADATAAPIPDGIKSWIGEAMARSLERELATFAAMDLGAAVPVL